MTEVAPTAFFVSSLPANFLGERLCSRRSCGCTRRTERYTGRFGRPGHTRFHIQTQRTPLSLSLRLRTSTRAGPGFAQHQGRDPGAHPECLPVHFTISYGPHHTVSSFMSPATGARLALAAVVLPLISYYPCRLASGSAEMTLPAGWISA